MHQCRRRPGAATRRRSRGGEAGAAAVEFALVLPVLMLLLLGIIQYSMYFWAMQGGADIARDAARRAAVSQPADCATFVQGIRAQVDDLTGTGSSAVVTRTYDRTVPPRVRVSDTVRVRVEFNGFDLHVPLVPFVPGGRVTQTAESRVEFVPTASSPGDCT